MNIGSFFRSRVNRVGLVGALAAGWFIAAIGAVVGLEGLLAVGVLVGGLISLVLAKLLFESQSRATKRLDRMSTALTRVQARSRETQHDVRALRAVVARTRSRRAASAAINAAHLARLESAIATLGEQQEAAANRVLEVERVLDEVRAELGSLRPTRRHVTPSGEGPRELALHDLLAGLPSAQSRRSTRGAGVSAPTSTV
jgi:hypothetical protein